MNVLLSAYACEPDKGSEPGVGWHWALELARLGHRVCVLTRANNEHAIRRASPPLPTLRFVYYDLPEWVVRLKKKGPFLDCYYVLWQWGAYHEARRLHEREPFDVVQHVTFGAFRHPSFMGRLNVPFIFGPVGGGERTPLRLRMDYGLRGHLLDGVRDLTNAFAKLNPWLHETLDGASVVLVKTPETARALPSRYRPKCRHLIEIGSVETNRGPRGNRRDGRFRFLFVGRFLYWKGMQYGLRAFARLLRDRPDVRLTLVGDGPEAPRWRRLSETLGIGHAVEWIGWIRHADVNALYERHDAFLFPSLHDSSGGAILEAMSYGLPVVCFDLGGPGVLVNESCGVVVPTGRKPRRQVIEDLADAMKMLRDQPERFGQLQAGALARARALTWHAAVAQVYGRAVPATGTTG